MLFATHLVGGYIAGEVTKRPILYVILGAAMPDIVDKPLGIMEITSHYHSFGHSIIIASTFLLIGLKYSSHLTVFTFGWIVHIFQDASHILINRGIERTTFIFYPFMFPDKPEIQNGTVKFASNFWSNYIGTTSFYLEFLIWSTAIVLFYYNFKRYTPQITKVKKSLTKIYKD